MAVNVNRTSPDAVEHNLKKSLEIIKARARRLRSGGKPGEGTGKEPGSITAGEKHAESEETSRDPLAQYKTGQPRPLEAIAPGEERREDGDTFYLLTYPGGAVDSAAPQEAEIFGRLKTWPQYVTAKPYVVSSWRRAQQEASQSPPFSPESVCFLDIETTGLSPNTYLFLCGLMLFVKGDFVVEQVFARNYEEEAGLLRYVQKRMKQFGTIVTYNGVKFDLPFIQTRLAVNRLPALVPFASVDLLYTARRYYRGVLPNNKLGTVERHLRGIGRAGDIPGKHIPAAYHDYVHSGDGRAIKNVLYHNRMDLFTMGILINRLPAAETP